jgi:flagellar biosynthesis protein FliR
MNQLASGLGLPELAGNQLVFLVLVLARVGPLFMLAPVLSANLFPARAKFVAALGLAVAITPIASQGQKPIVDPILLAGLFTKEIGIGIAFALALATISAAIEAGASVLDTLVGFSFGSLVDPITGVNQAVLGRIYMMFASMIFVVSGGLRLMIEGIARTYDVVPLGSEPHTGSLAKLAVSGLASIPVIGLELVGPVILAVVVADAAFGLVSRAVPQMNVFVIGLPVKVIISFTVVGLSLPFVAMHLSDDLQHALTQALQALGGH